VLVTPLKKCFENNIEATEATFSIFPVYPTFAVILMNHSKNETVENIHRLIF
jgi:hypothetical protein